MKILIALLIASLALALVTANASSLHFDSVVTEVGHPNPNNIAAGNVITAHLTYNGHWMIAQASINGRKLFRDREQSGIIITRPTCAEGGDIYYHIEGPIYVLVYAPVCPPIPPLSDFLLNQFFVQLDDGTPVFGKLIELPK